MANPYPVVGLALFFVELVIRHQAGLFGGLAGEVHQLADLRLRKGGFPNVHLIDQPFEIAVAAVGVHPDIQGRVELFFFLGFIVGGRYAVEVDLCIGRRNDQRYMGPGIAGNGQS